MALKSFGRALSRNQTLTILDLSRNSIDDRGGIALAQGLRANHTLINLNLYFCQIGDETACEFGLLFKKNKTLEFLSLSDNKISTRGFCALIDGLSENDTLEGNRIPPEHLKKLREAIKLKKTIIKIDTTNKSKRRIKNLFHLLFFRISSILTTFASVGRAPECTPV